MNILIISNFCSNYTEISNSRFTYLANLLSSNHHVDIVSSDFNHKIKKHEVYVPDNLKYGVHLLHETGYRTNICIKRFISHFMWAINVKRFLNETYKARKIDVIYCAIPPLVAALFTANYCKKHKIKFIIDIQDLWPEAFQMVLNIPIISNIVFAPFNWIANSIYKRADAIIAVSQTYVDRAMSVNKKCKKGYPVFLGTDLSKFDENVKSSPIANKLKEELWIGYCGTLGASYDLPCIFEALRIIKSKGLTPPKFIVMGSGYRENEFKEKAKDLNVEFTGTLPYPKMCGMLAACDLVVNPIVHKAAASIINKHADYASSGKPVINTQESFEYVSLVNEYNMGFNCKNGDFSDVSKKIELLINDAQMRKTMGQNARKCAEERFNRKKTYKTIISIIGGILSNED